MFSPKLRASDVCIAKSPIARAGQEKSVGGTIAYRLHGLNFSPFVNGLDPGKGDTISEEQLRGRMAAVAPYTRWVRTFSCRNGLENVGRLAHRVGLKVAIGAWLDKNSPDANQQEIKRMIRIALDGNADMLIVGSETLQRKDLSEEEIIRYIKQVKQAVPSIPVTWAD